MFEQTSQAMNRLYTIYDFVQFGNCNTRKTVRCYAHNANSDITGSGVAHEVLDIRCDQTALSERGRRTIGTTSSAAHRPRGAQLHHQLVREDADVSVSRHLELMPNLLSIRPGHEHRVLAGVEGDRAPLDSVAVLAVLGDVHVGGDVRGVALVHYLAVVGQGGAAVPLAHDAGVAGVRHALAVAQISAYVKD
jgi:hypothetical protein